jgi:hypothetical protein
MQISSPNNPLASGWARDDAEQLRDVIETICGATVRF